MTKEEILAVPGRELDALVMEKVMNQPIVKRAELTEWAGRYVYDPGQFHLTPEELYWQSKQQHGAWEIVGPRYSTDISAAWEVVEKMPLPFLVFKSYEESLGVGPIGWIVNWCDNYGDCGCFSGHECINGKSVWSTSAPEAICKAALKAVMVTT